MNNFMTWVLATIAWIWIWTPNAQVTQIEKTEKQDYIRPKSLFTVEDVINTVERQSTEKDDYKSYNWYEVNI